MIYGHDDGYGKSHQIKDILDEFVRSGYDVTLTNGSILITDRQRVERYGVVLHDGVLFHVDGTPTEHQSWSP